MPYTACSVSEEDGKDHVCYESPAIFGAAAAAGKSGEITVPDFSGTVMRIEPAG